MMHLFIKIILGILGWYIGSIVVLRIWARRGNIRYITGDACQSIFYNNNHSCKQHHNDCRKLPSGVYVNGWHEEYPEYSLLDVKSLTFVFWIPILIIFCIRHSVLISARIINTLYSICLRFPSEDTLPVVDKAMVKAYTEIHSQK